MAGARHDRESRPDPPAGAGLEAPLASPSRVEAILGALSEGVHVIDLEGRIVYENASALRAFGDPGPGLVGQPAHATVHHHRADGSPYPAEACPMHLTLRDGQVRRVSDEVFFRRDGSRFPVEYVCTPLRDAAGRIEGVVTSFRDVTEEHRTRGRLEERESLLRSAQTLAGMGTWQLDVASGRLTWSAETLALFGLAPAEFDGTYEAFISRVVPEDRAHLAAAHERAQSSGVIEAQYRVLLPDGAIRWLFERGQVEFDEWGAPVRRLGMVMDVTPLHSTLAALRASEATFRQVFASAAAGIAITTPKGEFLDANPAYCRMLGYSAEELRAFTVASLTHPEDRARNLALLDELLRGERQSFVIEKRYLTRAGGSVWARLSVALVRDDDGAPSRLIAVAEDIDEQRRTTEALLQRDHLLRVASRLGKLGGWSLTLPERTMRWSDETRAIFELGDEGPAVLATATALFAPEHRPGLVEAFERCITDGTPFDQEVEAITSRGRRSWVRISGEALRDDRGAVRAVQGALQDISDRRDFESALRESEERFRLLCRATNDAIWDWDLATDALWWNEGFETLFGYQRAEVEPTIESWTGRVHPEDRAWVVPAVERAIVAGESAWSGEYRFRRADGRWAYVLDRGSVIRDATGKAVRMVGGMTDLTERKAAEERLREQAALLENARDAILVRDLDGRLRYLNKRAEELYGWKREAIVGASVTDLQFARNRAVFQRANEATLRDGEWTGEFEQACADGSTVLVEGRWSLLRDPAGTPYGVLAINTDIRERKKLEQQLLRTQRMESIGTLAGGIAHDLNNVLTPILFSIGALREGERDPERLEDLASIEACARRGSEMVRQLLMFARGYEGERASVSMARVIREIERIVRDTFPKNITLRASTAADLWPIEADVTQLNQVLMNLCVNARDAMPQGGTLTLTAENVTLDEVYAGLNPGVKEGSYLCVRVEDTGTGMPPDVAERIFEPFFTTKPVGQGTGLGLSTTHAIIKSHGGFVSLYTELGKGTRFHVYLPATPKVSATEPIGAESAGLPRGQGEGVLVVDDEEPIRRMVQRTLERFGYRVLGAANGAEAMALFAQRRAEVQVVLTDMAMPIMDGAALVVALRSLDPALPIIGSSGLDANGKVAAAVGAGVKHFVAKPYTAETLLRTLQLALGARERR